MTREEQLAAWLEGDLDARGCESLARELERDDAFAREAAAQLRMRRLLGSLAAGKSDFTREVLLKVEAAKANAPELDVDNDPGGERTVLVGLRQRRWWRRAGQMTAGLAVAAAVALLLALWPDRPPVVRVLAAEGVQTLDMRALEEGRAVMLHGGILELALGTKSRLVIEGPAEFSVEAVDAVRLVSGRCYAEMEKGASGLRIHTPSGEVLDLGTRFGVEVSPEGGTSVHVFEGAVEVGAGGLRSRLYRGEAARWSESSAPAVIATDTERFVSRLPARGGAIPPRWIHWGFDEGAGDTSTPVGGGFPEAMAPARIHGARWIERDGSGALEFDGIDDWVETAFAGIGADADRTVAAWVRLAPDFGVASGQAIVGWGDFNIQDPNRRRGAAWELGIGDTTKPVDISGRLKVAVGGPLTVGNADLRDGAWHHVAAVQLGSGAPGGRGAVLLYVDGLLQRRSFGRTRIQLDTDVRSSTTEPVQFGRQVMRASLEREFFKGAIDEVSIVASALGGDDIRMLMQTSSLP